MLTDMGNMEPYMPKTYTSEVLTAYMSYGIYYIYSVTLDWFIAD